MLGAGTSLPEPCLRLLASVTTLPRNLQPGLLRDAQGGHRPQEELGRGVGISPGHGTVLESSLHWQPSLGGCVGAPAVALT